MSIKLTIPLSQIIPLAGVSEATTVDIELTPEQQMQVFRQCPNVKYAVGDPVEHIPVDICQRINSWEDAQNIVKAPYFLRDDGTIGEYEGAANRTDMATDYEAVNVPTERHAKSMLAFAQLSVIAEAYNEGWVPNSGNRNDYKHTVIAISGELRARKLTNYSVHILFHNEHHRDDCLKKFEQLWKDYWMID